MDEMQEIRRLWRFEKHEFDDSVPGIYHEATGQEFPVPADDDNLLDVEREYRGMSRRAGIYEAPEDRFKARQYESEEEALAAKQAEDELRKEADKSNERSLAIVQRELFEEED